MFIQSYLCILPTKPDCLFIFVYLLHIYLLLLYISRKIAFNRSQVICGGRQFLKHVYILVSNSIQISVFKPPDLDGEFLLHYQGTLHSCKKMNKSKATMLITEILMNSILHILITFTSYYVLKKIDQMPLNSGFFFHLN